MRKIFVAILAFFAFYSLATAEIYEYEASGEIYGVYSSGLGTDADDLLDAGERFTFRFIVDTDEILANHNDYLPQAEEAFYYQTHPVSVEFSGGFSAHATPIPSASWWDNYHFKHIDYQPLFPGEPLSRVHLINVFSQGADFVFSEPVNTDFVGVIVEFFETAEPYQIASTTLTELPGLADVDQTYFSLNFSDHDDSGYWEGGTHIGGLIDSLNLITNGKKPKKEKQLVCHVGNEVGPNGETYLDDPGCIPNELNDNFCPDAGKIDLIVVPKVAKHLDNPSHSWDGMSDYTPEEVGASGEGMEDSDGNGIDDGCEPRQSCPCWAEEELSAVSAVNLDRCDTDFYPIGASITGWFETPGVYVHFSAGNELDYGVCVKQGLDVPFVLMMELTVEEADSCVEQIVRRCSDIGYPSEY